MASILHAERPSAFGRLFAHVLRTNNITDVITTNYDRLLEVHAARAKVRVDTMYYGHTVGRLDAGASRNENYHPATVAGRSASVKLQVHPHVRLSKPHGSLDWFHASGEHLRTDLPIPGAEQIIAPGGNKYRLGYEVPFDEHRKRANSAIENATALFFVGYGFNDEHLQTYLKGRFPAVPSVMVSLKLSPNAREYLELNPGAIGIEAAADRASCLIYKGDDVVELDRPLWDLDSFVKEVLAL